MMAGWFGGGILQGVGGQGHPAVQPPAPGGPAIPPVPAPGAAMGNSPVATPAHPQGIGSGYNVLAALSQVSGLPIEQLLARGFKGNM